MACNFNGPAKIVTGVMAVLLLIAIIFFALSMNEANSAHDVEFVVENSASFTITENEGGIWGYPFAITGEPSDSKCEDNRCDYTKDGTLHDIPDKRCSSAPEKWMLDHEPKLQYLLNLVALQAGDYAVNCSTSVYVVDGSKELGEAVGGIFAAMGYAVIWLICAGVAAILACVGCCICAGCCCVGEKQ